MSPDSIYPTTPSLNIRSLGGHIFVSHIRMGFKNGVPELFLNVEFGHSNRPWLFISKNLPEGAHLPML